MDINRLISGRVDKIGNTYSISLNLFDTQNARSENAISEFCGSEDDLVKLVQISIRKLLGETVGDWKPEDQTKKIEGGLMELQEGREETKNAVPEGGRKSAEQAERIGEENSKEVKEKSDIFALLDRRAGNETLYARRIVPNVVGETVADSRRMLAEAGFVAYVERRIVVRDPDKVGRMLEQHLPGGFKWGPSWGSSNSPPSIRVKVGVPPTTEVPDLTGQTIRSATEILDREDLKMGRVYSPPSARIPCQIYSQHPAAGTNIARGQYVDVSCR